MTDLELVERARGGDQVAFRALYDGNVDRVYRLTYRMAGDAAVFALSRRPADESVPLLMELARTAERAGTRRSAMFWLAQSEDARVLAFFREILTGRGGG